MHKCQFCSTKNTEFATVCKACGKKLVLLKSPELAPAPSAKDSRQSKSEGGNHSKQIGKSLWGITATFAVVAAIVLPVLFTNGVLGKNSGDQATANAKKLNQHGMPLSCKIPELMALSKTILLTQLGGKGKIVVKTRGYSNSQVDVHNVGGQLQETKIAKKFVSLDCSYSTSELGNGGPALYVEMDSIPQPRSWWQSIEEQEVTFGFGETLAVYYPSGEGFEYGGGCSWRIWVGGKYLGINSWSETPKIIRLPQTELEKLLKLLKGKI